MLLPSSLQEVFEETVRRKILNVNCSLTGHIYVHIYKERLETHVFFSNAQDKFILRETIKADPILSCLILSYVSYPFLSYPVVHNLDGQWEQSGYLSFA